MDSLTEEEFDTFLPNEDALRSFTFWATRLCFRLNGPQVCGPSNPIAEVRETSCRDTAMRRSIRPPL